jgi:hypothetical protein
MPMNEPNATRRGWLRLGPRVVVGAGILLALVAVTVMLSNCGEHSSATVGQSQAEASGTPVEGSSAANAATPVSFDPGAGRQPEPSEAPADSLSPEVVAAVTDSAVTPGARVEITAQTTIDVSKVLLSDGLHGKQSFEYDVQGKVWKTTYRVPLRPASERIALSVTASNDHARWSRVWVFIRVQRSNQVGEVEPDSGEGCDIE